MTRGWLTAVAWSGLLGAMAGCGMMQRTVYESDFVGPPAVTGWTLTATSRDGPAIGGWAPAAAAGPADPAAAGEGATARGAGPVRAEGEPGRGDGWLRVTRGAWLGPAFAVEGGGYYELTMKVRSAARGFAAVRFYDAAGRENAADMYTSIYADDDVMAGPADDAGWRTQSFCFRGRQGAATARVMFSAMGEPVEVDQVTVRRIDRRQALAWADAVYAQVPAVRYEPPADRWAHLPRTRAALERGGRLRIVILGDSIANDTSNSFFAPMLERAYPGARIELIRSVESGKGCPYYREAGRVDRYVLRHRPDLLIIAGISHGGDVAAMRDVIGQVRAGSPPDAVPEVLVLNGAIAPNTSEGRRRGAARFAAGLAAMAQAEGVGFMDIRSAYDAYVAGSGRDHAWFMRDEVHGNDRGKQVVGRMLVRHLGPTDAVMAKAPGD